MPTAVWHVMHDGRLFEPGQILEIDGPALERLLASGAALPSAPPAEPPAEAAPEPAPEAETTAGRRPRRAQP